MASIHAVNPKADLLRHGQAVAASVSAGHSLQNVVSTNLGPRGTYKLLVGGAGQLKLTKDGNVLLTEMHIQHPIAAMIARGAAAQDVVTGDGSTSDVVVCGELLTLAERYLQKGVHPRLLCAGLDIAREKAVEFLQKFQRRFPAAVADRELLTSVARSSLFTKVQPQLAEQLTSIVVDALQCLVGPEPKDDEVPDLFMVEVLAMKQGLQSETKFIRGMVMDHGCRHPDMPSRLADVYTLTCNVSLEYERTEVNSAFFYSSADQRARLADAERRFVDAKVRKIIELKREVCGDDRAKGFAVFNQKGIDPASLDMLAREGIMALRRVKRRNMERLTLCCGGAPVNSVDDLTAEDLGFAKSVWETSMGDEKYTFVEGVKDPRSCAILIRAPTDYAIDQIKDAVRDGLRAVRNCIVERTLVPGAGAFELACSEYLKHVANTEVQGKAKLGLILLADAMLAIPRALSSNAGLDAEDTIIAMEDEFRKLEREGGGGFTSEVGVDLVTGGCCVPSLKGIWDSAIVKRQMVILVVTLAAQLLLVDEIIKAGRQMGNQGGGAPAM